MSQQPTAPAPVVPAGMTIEDAILSGGVWDCCEHCAPDVACSDDHEWFCRICRQSPRSAAQEHPEASGTEYQVRSRR